MPFLTSRILFRDSIVLTLIAFLGIVPAATSAAEADLTRYLAEYVRSANKPVASNASFFGTEGAASLIVLNGDGSGSDTPVTSAIISLNGHQVLGPNDFRNAPGMMEVPVDLLDENEISVELRGIPGSSLTVRVKQHVDVSLNITGRIHFNTNVSSYDVSRPFYSAIGFVGGIGFPDTNTLAVAESLGIETPTSYDGSLGPEAGGYLLHGNLIFLASFGGLFIDLIEFTIPRNLEPPYAALNHLGMARAALLTSDVDADYAYMNGVLGIEFLSPPASRSNGVRFAIFKDPDGTFYELVQAAPPVPLPTVFTNIFSVGPVSVNVSDFERSREFYRMLGFTHGIQLPETDSVEVAQAMGFDEAFTIRGEMVTFAGDGSAIELVQWIDPVDLSPPYPLPINHLGINRLAYSTNDLLADVAALKAQGVRFVSEIAPCCSGPASTSGIVSFFDPDGTLVELVGPIVPPP